MWRRVGLATRARPFKRHGAGGAHARTTEPSGRFWRARSRWRLRLVDDPGMSPRGRLLAAGLSIVVLASLAGPAPAVAAAFGGTSTGGPGLPCAAPLVADPVGGAAAVRELGANLPVAAAKIDRSPAEFRALLRSDPTMRVDQCGQTFAVDPAMTAAQVSAAAAADVPVAAAALSTSGDAFALNSRPGSDRTIYLDFNGQTITGTAWNDIHPSVNATPYDTDGSPASFSSTERAAISSIWLRVSEDYAPFDVNVTTQDPGQAAISRDGASDQLYGTRALITMDSVLFEDECQSSCGGIAFLDAVDLPSQHDKYQPALVFQRGLGGSHATAKLLAEATAHEVGHNFGLSHDGTASAGYYLGQGAWAPIMGAGYDKPVSQWSAGEYAGANNQEDDVAVIAAHGAALVADDHADSATGATPVTYAGSAVSGLIGTRTDTDWFTFTVPAHAGETSVRVTPQSVGGDLDASLTVRDSSDGVWTSNPSVDASGSDQVTGLASSVTLALPAGAYTAKVDGVGFGTAAATGYSDYASLGRYTISVGGPVAPPPPAGFPKTWSGSLRAAVAKMTVRSESGSGYAASKFPLVDADHDCRNTRAEVLSAESRRTVSWTTARDCVVSHGEWFSTFDRRTAKAASHVAAVWTVPLSEAWQSGARSWTKAHRKAYANDLGDARTLIAVTAKSAKARGNREPTSWLPKSASRCGYVTAWVAVKLRWGLTINSAEKTRLAYLATGCSNRLTVHRA
jgi:Metallo-peptidase family M12B Reprolysin-like